MRTAALSLVVVLAACGGEDAVDAGNRAADALPSQPDAGASDASIPADAAPASDTGVTADTGARDASDPRDATASPDRPLGGTAPGSLQIEEVIRAPARVPIDVRIDDVLVTYVKPDGTGDLAGFFVQAEREGPALFVPVAATSSTSTLTIGVGDRINFRVTEAGVSNEAARAAIVEDLVRSSTGTSVEPLRQEVSAETSLVSAIERWQSELVRAEITIAGAWEDASAGHKRARVTTAGAPVPGTPGLWLRVPVPAFDIAALPVGCTLGFDGVLWRFRADAQLSSYVPRELTPCR